MKRIVPILLTLVILFACKKKEDPAVTAINLDKTELTLKVGEKYSFKVTHTPLEAKTPEYTWTTQQVYQPGGSVSMSIVEVDENGVITAMKEGTTRIIVSTKLTDIVQNYCESECVVTIEPTKAESIKLNKSKVAMKVGEEETLTYTITPETTTNKDVVWSSSDLKIATVSNGLIKAVGAGTATVSVSVKNTLIKDACEVTIDPAKVEGLKLKESEKTVLQGESFKLTPVFTPVYATNRTIKWTSSNEKIALVDNDGNVKTIGYGECVIKAVSEDGGFEATCITIVKPIPVQGIKFDSNRYEVEIGGKRQLKASIYPENAGNKEVVWSSSNDIIAPIDQKGVVTGNITGFATITAQSVDGGFRASTNIWVEGIDEFVDLYFPSSSVVIINGFLTGSIYSGIRNNSSKTITLTKFGIIDSNTWRTVAETTDESKLGNLSPGQTTSLGGQLNSVYEPIFVWDFTCNGVKYSRIIKYGNNTPYSTTINTIGSIDSPVDLNRLEK